MNRLILSVALPALLLAACATAAPERGAPPAMTARTPPPHMPTDLSPAGVRAADDHLALEEVNGTEAMAFVAGENARSLAVLTGDRRYETFRQEAFDILSATDRIAQPTFLGDGIGNFWQDATNPKGLWRRTTLDSYRTEAPVWETLLDIDALSKAEGKDWVWKGADCLAPDDTRCLVSLSDGGKDAVVVREFDTRTGLWVEDGFILPEGKHRLEWLDRDTLLVATDFGPGTLTESGYPYIVKALKRGQTLAQATELYRGDIGDGGYGVSPSVYRDGAGKILAVLISRPLDTFRSETWEVVDGKPVKLDLPERVGIRGVMDQQLVFTLDEAWTWQGRPVTEGSLLAADLSKLRSRPGSDDVILTNADETVFIPSARQSIEDTERRQRHSCLLPVRARERVPARESVVHTLVL